MVKIEISGDTPTEVATLVALIARDINQEVDVRELADKVNRMQTRELRKRGLSKSPADDDG